jgi:hypothetical protein
MSVAAVTVSPAVIEAFRLQVEWCRRLGSPFSAGLLDHAVSALEAGRPLARLIGGWAGDPKSDALALRLLGALHALALSGTAPALTMHFPGAGRAGDADAAWRAAEPLLIERAGELTRFLRSPPQTNEIGRSGILLGGFLEIARRFGRPLRLLEIGASAGLNQLWDRFHYRLGDHRWGDPASPVEITAGWTGGRPPLDTAITVASRAACDKRPIDLGDDDQCQRLRAYVWADQPERRARLDGAIALARREGIGVEQSDAADWLEARLGEPAGDAVDVIYHSVVWQYVALETRERIKHAMAGAAAGGRRVAWLRFEPPEQGGPLELRLNLWPSGEFRRLATAHPHGATIEWLGA